MTKTKMNSGEFFINRVQAENKRLREGIHAWLVGEESGRIIDPFAYFSDLLRGDNGKA